MKCPQPSATFKTGVAIVVTVIMVALLAVLIVAFLALAVENRKRVDADAGGREASALAASAEALITADLLEEMRAGSASMTGTPDGGRLFDVTDAKSMIPARVLVTGAARLAGSAPFATLVKQSASGKAFDGKNGAKRAGNVSTSDAAIDGRSFKAKRWLAPRLFQPDETLADPETPDWIYLSRDGGNPTAFSAALKIPLNALKAPEPAYVIGRYAYQIYETGGLLDANVAGHGGDASAADAATKGSLVWADLTTLPGAGAEISGLPIWRHPSGWVNARRELVEDWGQPRGWQEAWRSSGRPDNVFLGRRDLISFQQAYPGRFPAAALPYFTHLTFELNQPSWSPVKNATGDDFAYFDNRDKATAPNRRILNVRAMAGFTRWSDPEEGAVSAKAGEPLVKRRFPLRWIEWFKNPAANAGLIARHFGLARDADGYRWIYGEFDSANRIKTLDEVAKTGGREPNFFELLNAGILSGSLASGTGASKTFFNNPDIDSSTARHILRIGACIIDQYDGDDDPTVIVAVPSGDPFGPADLVDIFGVENLPYIDVIGQKHIRRRDLPGYPGFPHVSGYYQLQVWNPHRDAQAMNPGRFRIIGEGEPYVLIGWWPQSFKVGPVYYERGEGFVADETSCFMEFAVPLRNESNFPRFEKPVQLLGKHLSAWSPDNVLPGGTATPKFAGIHLGKVKCGEGNPAAMSRYPNSGPIEGHVKFFQPLTIKLQKRAGSAWVTYQTIPFVEENHGNGPWPATVEEDAYNGIANLRISFARSDPRTIRFGMSSADLAQSVAVNSKTIDPDHTQALAWGNRAATGGGLTGTKGCAAQLAFNDGTGWSYSSRDGIRRPADPDRMLPAADGNPYAAGDARPHILNRAFRSVAEMGYAFRDEPWKTLDFGKESSADSGLLDLFTLSEASERAGVLNPNTTTAEVLTSVLAGMELDPASGSRINPTDAGKLATEIRNSLRSTPIRNPGELVERAQSAGRVILGKKERQIEALARGLADVSSTRSWTLMIDLVAQSGHLLPSATGLNDFAVRGEKRVWIHLVIDRFTGETLARQIEPVFE